MTILRRLFLIIMLVAALVVAAGFAWLNPGAVQLDLGFGVVAVPVSYALIACLAVGWLLGLLTASVWLMRSLREKRKLARSVRKAEAEVENLQKLPLADGG
jgi:uncharacterized integral membrane protein